MSFPYVLIEGVDACRLSMLADEQTAARLRFGSTGRLVESVQDALKERHYYEGAVDGEFGERTMRAVLTFQQSSFGSGSGDGIVGPITAEALGLVWPQI